MGANSFAPALFVDMTPLAQLVCALLESSDPVADLGDDVMMRAALEPLESLFAARDLLTATAVLEAVTPMILETTVLLDNAAAAETG
jgi:hypothetical protein